MVEKKNSKKAVAKKKTSATKKSTNKKVSPVAKKSTKKKVSVANKPSVKKTTGKEVVLKAPVKKTVVAKKATNKKAVSKKSSKASTKKGAVVKAQLKSNESFNDTLLRRWLVGNNNASLSENKFNYFKHLIGKFERRDGRFTLSWNIFAALYNFLYSFFRKDYVGGVFFIIMLKLIDSIFTVMFIETGIQNSMISNFMYVLAIAIFSSSVISYLLFKKFENDKRIIANISDKEDALKVIQELGGTHNVWKFVMIILTIALFAASIWLNAVGLV